MSHAPKQRALEAYVAELLSAQGKARVERHLRTCAPCSDSLSAVRAYAAVREEAAREEVPLLRWEQLEAALDATPTVAPARARSGKVVALMWPLLAVAATLVIGWIGLSGSRDQELAQAPKAKPVSATPAPQLAAALLGRVTLLAGSVTLAQQGAETPLQLDSPIPEGARIVTGAAASVHVWLSDGTGFALGENSELDLSELRIDGVQLKLARGSVANQVHKLGAQQHYWVEAGDLRAEVRGTRFDVERPEAQKARVSVHEGRVEVLKQGRTVATLTPGMAYEDPASGDVVQPSPERAVHGAAQLAGDWAALSLPPLANLNAWIIDGARVAPQGGLSMRLPRDTAELAFEDARGQVRTIPLDLREMATVLDAAALSKLVAPKESRSGHLEPEQISQVIKAGLDPLRRCYERGLRVVPTLAGKLTLSMRVGADGRVLRALPTGSKLPVEVERCISQEASRWVFPKPEGGGAVAFDVPLNLKSH